MENVVQYLVKATEEIASSYCLQNTTTSEEIEECKGLLERSIAAHPELLSLKPEDLHRNHLTHYDELTSKMTVEQKKVFTIDLYDSMVEASVGAMRLLLQVPLPSLPQQDEEMEEEMDDDDDEITVTRDDLVVDYIGLTEKKTVDFLEANRGKVILLEERNVCHGDDDIYGKQALVILNRWFKDHPEETLYRSE